MARDISINLDAPHPAQEEVSLERSRFNVLSCGRRWGKTHFTYQLLAEIVKRNLMEGFSEDMGYMSPTYKNLLPTWRRFTKTFAPLITHKSEQNFTAEIMGQFLIEFWSLDKPENIRGRQYKRIIIDEAALVIALKEIFKLILLPTIGDLVGDAWFFSTPRGFNDFEHFYRNGQNPLLPEWASWIKPTSSNPYFPKAELDSQRSLIDPTEYAQEWEGKFVSLGNSPFNVENFTKYKTFDEALAKGAEEQVPLYKIRYWDIADSEDGDYTASLRLTVTNTPRFILSNAVRYKGKWGSNMPYIRAVMLNEPDVVHVFETEGVGGIAWQMIQMDPLLATVQKYPAGRIFTSQDKAERAQLWAMELQNGRMDIVQDANWRDVLDEIAAFPAGANDDWVDSISGGMLSFIYFFGGYRKLLASKKVQPKSVRPAISYEKQSLINTLQGF